MARCPIVKPDVIRVSLSDGEFLDLKRELNAGESRDMFLSQVKEAPMGERPILDLQQVGLSKVLAYLVGWSFVGLDGAPLAVNRSTLRLIDTETFREIVAAVETHDEAVEAAREARKNGQIGETPASVSSPSAA